MAHRAPGTPSSPAVDSRGLLARAARWLRRLLPGRGVESRTQLPPDPRSLRRIRLAAERHLRGLQAGDRASPFAGAGVEVDGVRPYQAGDPVRSVDWRVTARRDALHLRTWREDRDLPVILVLDRRGTDGTGPDAASREAFRWLAFAASAAGHPLGVRTVGREGVWLAPSRGRRVVQRVLAAAEGPVAPDDGEETLPEALDSLLGSFPVEGLVCLVGPFAGTPEETAELGRAVARLSRRHRVVPVWTDPVTPLPPAGLLEVVDPKGRRHLVDASSPAVRDRHATAVGRWREEVRRAFAPAAPPVIIRPGDRVETALARAFTPRRGGGGGARRRRRVATRALASALLALLSPGLLGAQLLPGQLRVVEDSVGALVLGEAAPRRTVLATSPGARLELSAPEGSGEVWDVAEGALRLLDADGTRWEVTSRVIPWWMGSQALPEIPLLLVDAAGTRTIRVAAGRREIDDPRPTGAGPGITWPAPPAGGSWGWVAVLPLGAALLGGGLLLLPMVLRLRARVRRLPPIPIPDPEEGPPREVLDRVMGALRLHLDRTSLAPPAGWTEAWGLGELDPSRAQELRAVLAAADGPRFRPVPPSRAQARAAVAALRQLVGEV